MTPRLNKRNQAMVLVGYAGTGRLDRSLVFRIDWRRLERNKYAPWGRGDLT